jgi:uncharacterized protein
MVEQEVLEQRILGFAGRPARPSYTARYPVNEAMIRHWTDAHGDRNPDYPELAPPAMLALWTMPGLAPEQPDPGALDELVELLLENGYTGVVATNLSQEFDRYLRPGELVTATPVIDAVAGPRTTALGSGFFLDVRTDFTVEEGERVGTATMRMLRYRPREKLPKGKRRRPVKNQDTSFFWEGAAAGELRIQRCRGCGELRSPPRPMCASCRSLEWDWTVASGRGTVYSYIVHHAPQMPGQELPFVVVLVDLEERTRLVANLTGCEPSEVKVGMPVEVYFEQVAEDVLPFFRPARSAVGGR